jgi:4-hydroxy-tetrahydrodipicolinate reductase
MNGTEGSEEVREDSKCATPAVNRRWEEKIMLAALIFELPDQRLTIRHASGNSARPYADGALLAIRRVWTLVGVHRGLDSVLEL